MDDNDETSFFGGIIKGFEEKEKTTGYFKGNVSIISQKNLNEVINNKEYGEQFMNEYK